MKSALLLVLLLLTACTQAAAPTPVPTADPFQWKTYTSLEHHFTFDYPATYEDHAICKLKESQPELGSSGFTVSLGNSDLKAGLAPLANPKDTPQTAVDALRSYWAGEPRVTFDNPIKRTVAGQPALTQVYHIPFQNRQTQSTFFIKDGTLYTLTVNIPATCDGYPNTPDAAAAYARMLQSFTIK